MKRDKSGRFVKSKSKRGGKSATKPKRKINIKKNAKLIKKLNKYAFVKGLNSKQTEKQIIKKWLGMK